MANGRRSCLLLLGLLWAAGGCVSPSSTKALEDSLLYLPAPFPQGDWNPRDLPVEDAWFQADDGAKLHGWFCEAPNPKAVVLFCHGNAGNITTYYWRLRFLRERMGVSVLIFDYRGYGKSTGTPSEGGILADARAARRWLAQRTKIAEKEVVLLGYSLGGAVAVDLAARDGARALVLENTFTSIPDVAAQQVRSLPLFLLVTTRLDSISKIGFYKGPLLQTHGDADRVVPFDLGLKLFDAANEPKQFVRVPGGGHSDPPSREYAHVLERFLESLPPTGRPR